MPTLIEQLQKPECYAHSVAQIELIETHISWVLLTGDYAYKIKKPIRNEFLNFSMLDLRKHFCETEVTLNKRYAPDIYLEVVPIYGPVSTPRMGSEAGSGEAIEYAVKMRQFASAQRLDKQLERGKLSGGDVDRLARDIARLHMQAPVFTDARHGGDPNDHAGEPDQVIVPALDNFQEICQHPPEQSSLKQEAELEQWTVQQSIRLRPRLLERKAQGKIRDCHGDLHLQNLFKQGQDILPFDCIEFNPEWRHIDVINDVAVLFVDFLVRDRADFAYQFLNVYLEQTGDYEALDLLAFYGVYRCMVRAKVQAMRLSQSLSGNERNAVLQSYQRYISTACSLVTSDQPTVMVMCGLSGSGKSFVAAQLMSAWPAIRVRSDTERKRIHCYQPDEDCSTSIHSGIYSSASSKKVYQRLRSLASSLSNAGFSVIIDAANLQRSQRDGFRRWALSHDVRLLFVHCEASYSELQRRITSRSKQQGEVSDADLDVLAHQANSAELPGSDEARDTVHIDTEVLQSQQAIMERIQQALHFIAA